MGGCLFQILRDRLGLAARFCRRASIGLIASRYGYAGCVDELEQQQIVGVTAIADEFDIAAMSLSLLKFAGQASLVDEAMLPS